jgi:hydrogenase maturation protease
MSPSDVPVVPILIVACGNVLAGDDAFGPLVAQRLRQLSPKGTEIIDLGTKPAGLLDHLPGRHGVIIVDAAEPSSGSAGELIDMDFMSSCRPPLRHDVALSSHGLSIAHELALARTLGMLPVHVHLIAAATGTTQIGEAPTVGVLQSVEPAANRVAEIAAMWLSTWGAYDGGTNG